MKNAAIVFAIALVCAGLSLLSVTPRVTPWAPNLASGSIEEVRAPELARQLAHPLAPVGPALRWRLLMPAAGHALGLSLPVYFCLPYAGILALLCAVCGYARRIGGEWLPAAVATLLVATSAAFYVATGWLGQMDTFYVLALVVFTFTGSPLAAGLACAAGPWIDERFLIVLPVFVLVRRARGGSWRSLAMETAPAAAYVLCRLAAVAFAHGGATIADQVHGQFAQLGQYASNVPAGWWHGFRAGWLAVAAGVLMAARGLPGVERAALLFGLAAGVALIAFLAWDTSRSIAALIPFLVLGVLPWPGITPPVRRWALLSLALLNLLCPAANVVADATIYLHSFLT